ncbi:type IV pilin N-terminal domain-containing protein [Halorhabdus sp. BNX81]|uniref:type IV pilin N-terminal domain-containing protein n=1 Tax=Halorhabdus sp. BNX81 TaxID=2980181 RepID=UPI0023DCF752|nr:type IV pilin N-terminal domain-containing protein [Halorhabdus sp. BNX81]WEL20620.1 Pilin/Flagellin, FlaG/FlaF family [Halorhabdus sp. BNX81]
MNLKDYLFDDDRGVSPVIGVILMVAITVILAAVIATFVMNMGPSESTPANANWDASFDIQTTGHDSFTLTHEGGGEAVPSEYVLSVSGVGNTTNSDVDLNFADDLGRSDDMGASDEVVMDENDFDPSGGSDWSAASPDTLDLSGATVELIWQDPEGDQSQVINTYEP